MIPNESDLFRTCVNVDTLPSLLFCADILLIVELRLLVDCESIVPASPHSVSTGLSSISHDISKCFQPDLEQTPR